MIDFAWEFFRRLAIGVLLGGVICSSAVAQKPPINGVAGPTTSAQFGSIITNPFGSPSTGDRVLFATPANNGVLITNGTGVPSISTTLPAVNSAATTYTQSGTGAVSRSLGQRNAGYMMDTEFGTQTQAFNQSVATNVPLLQAPSINVGSVCGSPPTSPCVGGTKVDGFILGHSAIGNFVSGTDAFVGLHGDENYSDVNQEMRGVSYTLRYHRTTADEPILGWDSVPGSFATVVTSANTQNIVGNMKAVVSEIHYDAPAVGSYSVRNTYGVQSTLVTLGAGVTLTNYQGMIVSPTPVGGGTITTGYGVEIGAITATTAAALKLDGLDAAGRILWTDWGVTEKSDTNLHFQSSGTDYLTLSTTTAAFAVPVGISGSFNAGDTTNVLHAGFGTAVSGETNTAWLAALQPGIAYRSFEIDGAALFLNHNSAGTIELGGALKLNNAYVGTPCTNTGTVAIKDSTGTTVRVMVCNP